MTNRTAYFLLNGRGVYEHVLVAIAEGLRTHGFVTVGDRPYWQQSTHLDDFLIRRDPDVGPEDGDILLVSSASVDAATGRLADDVRATI